MVWLIENILQKKIYLTRYYTLRGAGRTIKNAAKRLSEVQSSRWYDNFFSKFTIGKTTIDYRECGANGAAMRILPIALANGKWDKIKEGIFGNNIITHGHTRAILGGNDLWLCHQHHPKYSF